MPLIEISKALLKEEPEVWINYLHGQQLENLPHLLRERPRYRGLVLQIAKFAGSLLRAFRLNKQPQLNQLTEYFVFAGTVNQMRSLDQTIASLMSKGGLVLALGNPAHLMEQDHYKGCYLPLQLTLLDIARALLLFSTRGWGLYRVLKSKRPVAVDWHFSTFCSVYTYLSYFYRVLSQVRPGFVITANDHNVPNRCMLAVAHHLGIKTVYLQHASVSNLFPALRVNYAFLDGQCALDTYRKCELNQPATPRSVPIPQVILSGQKTT